MANFAYNVFKTKLMNGTFNLNNSDTIKVRLVDTNTTADTEKDKTLMNGFTTSTAYSGTTDQTLTGESTSQDDTDNEGVFDASDTTFSAVSISGGLDIEGMIVYQFVTDDTDSIPMLWIEDGGFNITPNGSDIVITWASEGILNLT